MVERFFLLTVDTECREILRERRYSADKSAKLIEWLRVDNAAVNDLAGHALNAMGTPAFDDLFQRVTESGAAPWPIAVWTLTLFRDSHIRLLPMLRLWLSQAEGELERQCAVSLAGVLLSRHQLGHLPDPADLAACRRVLEENVDRHQSLRITLRTLKKELELNA